MSELNCTHCGNEIKVGDKNCPSCGIPLSPNLGKYSQLKFKLFFIGVVIFCVFMILWLPPNWTEFMGEN